jgi:Tol biopolymer transport system component
VLQFHQLTYSGHVLDAVLSPDGKFLAHVDSTPAGTSLHLLSIASHSDVQIVPPGNGCCASPSFSPDGGQVYFLQKNLLKSVPVLGGTVTNIAELACSGAGFSTDGSQIAFMTDIGKLTLARPDGSQARVLASEQAGGGFISDCWNNGPNAYHAPAWSPDGKLIATLLGPATGDMRVQVVDTGNGSVRNIGPALQSPGEDLNWLPDGRGLIFTATIPDSDPPQLWEISYPAGRMTRLTNDLQGYVGASLASDGALTLVHATPQASVWVQSKPGGEFQALPGGGPSLDGAHGLAWTPGGDLLSVRVFGSQGQLWSEGRVGGDPHPLAIPGAPGLLQRPVVAPDGQIFFTASTDGVNGQWNLYSAHSDGSGLRQLLHLQPGQIASGGLVLVHGGRQIVYLQIEKNTEQHLWIANADGSDAHQLLPDFVLAASLAASPDGNRLLARRRLGNTTQMMLVDLHGSTPTVTPIAEGFEGALTPYDFTPDGRAIVYKHRQGSSDNLWAFPLDGGKPHPLTHFDDLSISAYALTRDGRLAVSRRAPNSDVVVATGLGKNH